VEIKIQDILTVSRKQEEEKAIAAIKENAKFFYKYAAKYSKTKSNIGPFINEQGQSKHEPKEIAERLKVQYDSVFSQPDPEKKIQNAQKWFRDLNEHKPQLTDFIFSHVDIEKAIDKLSNNSAGGPDGFPAILLKKCKLSLSKPIYSLWRESMDQGQVPLLLKQATITPIHKGGSRSEPKNYRPISLTSHLTKIFERVLREKLVAFLEGNNLLNANQHGFRSKRSCLTQLLENYDTILNLVEEGKNVDVVYLDFAKAFDKVDHGILCHKLKQLGIGGKVGTWIHNFLSDRTQSIIANGASSTLSQVISSVPQGTVLGPILFLVLIGDINNNTCSHVSSFADDTRVLLAITNEDDVKTLQNDLKTIYKWQQINNMQFNENKFELLRYGKNQHIKDSTSYYGPNGRTIERTECVKDLGVKMSDTLRFTDHIETICTKVRQKCGWIIRTFHARDLHTMKTLWCSIVQPHIDYCSQLWTPHRVGDIQKIESLFRSFSNKIYSISDLNYWDRLSALKMYSQERRMERYRIIYIWKILEGISPNVGIESFTSPRQGRLCRVPQIKLCATGSIRAIREGSLHVRGPQLFNSLPVIIRGLTGCSVISFKHKLDKYLQTIPDKPKIPGYTIETDTNSITSMRSSRES
jgi:hypothetical protein